MKYFSTLFDRNYLYKGLALYESLKKQCSAFHLYIFALDDTTHEILSSQNLDFITVIHLSEIETEALLKVKPLRNKVEYYWTCGPESILYAIKNFKLPHCTYLDADLYFFNNPDIIFNEIGDNSVGLTEHFIDKDEIPEGKYCVQFLFFRNDTDGMAALKWWADRCVDWCYARFEDGKYGDQKYLEQIPEKYGKVYIIQNRGAGVAPWNVNNYRINSSGILTHKDKKYHIVFYHYHGIRVQTYKDRLTLKAITYDISNEMRDYLYMPYLEQIKEVYKKYFSANFNKLKIIKRSRIEQTYSFIKRHCRDSSIIRFLYYDLFKMNYKGYEKPKQ